MVAIGLRKHYARSESGSNLVMYDVLFTRYDDVVYGIEIPGKYLEYQNDAQ